MGDFAPEVRARMPLAEATLLIFRHAADPAFLESLFNEHRGRAYTKRLSFPQMFQLTADCLMQHGGSGRRGFETAREAGELRASIQAVYGKLRRMPIDVSRAFLAGCTERLMALDSSSVGERLPASLADHHVLILDAKTVKWVHKRLKALRPLPGGMVGGKALIVLSLNLGLALRMAPHPDGDAGETTLVSEAVEPTRRGVTGPRLWIADRQYGYPSILRRLAGADADGSPVDAFVVRARNNLTFTPDPDRPPLSGVDADGRSFTQTWGRLGRDDEPLIIRRIVLERPGEEPLIIQTNLLDAERYPAKDLLALYRMRWGIERVFQKITEVFGLKTLIGGSPEATIFQLAFCLLIYNAMQVTRGYLAAAQQRPAETISMEKLFEDVTDQLIAWNLFLTPTQSAVCLEPLRTLEHVRARLHELLDPLWRSRWIKSPPQQRRRPPPKTANRKHVSVYRALKSKHTDADHDNE